MGRFSSPMKTEVASVARQTRWAIQISTPTPIRVSFGGFPAPGIGNFVGRLKTIESFTRGGSNPDYSLSAAELVFLVIDEDSTVMRAARGPAGASFKGTTVTQWLATANTNVSSTDWLTHFSGIVDQYEVVEPFIVRIRARSDDRRLLADVPVNITPADWPAASEEARGQLAPRVYGTHDSAGGTGAVKLLLVDRSLSRYAVALGWIAGVDRVYSDGAQVLTGWSVVYTTINGRRWTLVAFTTSQGDAEITADVRGYTDASDGSGTLIENQVDQLKHFIVNWMYGDYRAQSAWIADATAPIDTTYFTAAATFLTARGYKGSRVIGGTAGATGLSVLNEWTGSLFCQPFWTGLGKLALTFFDHGVANSGIYIDDTWIKGTQQASGIAVKYDAVDLVSQVSMSYAYRQAETAYIQSLNVRDPTVTAQGVKNIELPWSYSGS